MDDSIPDVFDTGLEGLFFFGISEVSLRTKRLFLNSVGLLFGDTNDMVSTNNNEC